MHNLLTLAAKSIPERPHMNLISVEPERTNVLDELIKMLFEPTPNFSRGRRECAIARCRPSEGCGR
jgi:hypothetical protein